jgi:DNA-binding GntR family transcriptional regulator
MQRKSARPLKTALRKGTGARRAYEALREQILSLQLAPGTDLDEAAMVRKFGASRTPIREAFIRLASENLITLLPNRGARVAELSLMSTREFFEALSLTQRALTRWAVSRQTPETLEHAKTQMLAFELAMKSGDARAMAATNRDFHIAIAACAQNLYLAKTYRELLDEGMRLSRLGLVYETSSVSRRAAHLQGIVDDHREMIEAIEQHDADRAERIAQAHTQRFQDRITDYLQASGQDSINVTLSADAKMKRTA